MATAKSYRSASCVTSEDEKVSARATEYGAVSIDKAFGARHPLGKPRVVSNKVSVVIDVLEEV